MNKDSLHDFIFETLKKNIFVFESMVANPAGRVEEYYTDIAGLSSIPNLFNEVVNWYSDLLKNKDFDHICGLETASLPLVGAIGYKDQLSALYLRKKRKEYGMKKLVEGEFEKGDTIYIVDDVSVEAKPTLEFVKLAESEGLIVKGVIVTYKIAKDETCKNVFNEKGYEYYSMFGYDDLIEVLKKHYSELGYDKDTYKIVLRGSNLGE